MRQWIDQLRQQHALQPEQYHHLLTHAPTHASTLEYLQQQAREVAHLHFGNQIYIRGLIEVSNCCRNDCYYCGIRRSNTRVERYRLSKQAILDCCQEGHRLGFRTFVLQGGEDPALTTDRMVEVVEAIRGQFPDCAITLSLGEKSHQSYQRLFDAGANRYLLRHETYNPNHYNLLHPSPLTISQRLECLHHLQRIGFQTGTGIMVGSPGQTVDDLVADVLFIQQFNPQMIGIGPFLPHSHTPFAHHKAGSLTLTLTLLSLFRLMHPTALIPSTTALATLTPDGRQQGILSGANVVMPNLSPPDTRSKYELYNNKASLGAEAAQGLQLLQQQLQAIGYQLSTSRGDFHPLT